MTIRNKLLTSMLALSVATWGEPALAQSGRGDVKQDPTGHGAMGHQEMMHGAGQAGAVKAWHGGMMMKAGDREFETVATPEGICVYGYDTNGTPMRLDKASGTVTVHMADGTSREADLKPQDTVAGEPTAYFCPVHPDATQLEPGICRQCGGMKLTAQDVMFGAMNMWGVAGALRAEVALKDVPGEKEPVTFVATVQMKGMGDMPSSMPMGTTPKGLPSGKDQLGTHQGGGK
jgi:hypothetical protein